METSAASVETTSTAATMEAAASHVTTTMLREDR
jgi:hypothetical protein